jgi:signal peptidase I
MTTHPTHDLPTTAPEEAPSNPSHEEASIQALPLHDDVAFALQRGQHMALRHGLAFEDVCWLLGSLATADSFSTTAAWWSNLGVEKAQQKAAFIRGVLQQKQQAKPNILRNTVVSVKRFVANMLFFEVPSERRSLEAFLQHSSLYQKACQLANGAGVFRVEWVHWFEAAAQLHPEWNSMLGVDGTAVQSPSIHGLRDAIHQSSLWRNTLYWLKETVQFILVFQLVTIGVRQGLGEFRLIPSGSMEPTLQVGDRIFIEKPSNYLNLPFKRGDILVFVPPGVELQQGVFASYLRLTGMSGFLPPLNDALRSIGVENALPPADAVDLAYIKRLVALPGDHINVVPGVGVYINNVLLDEPFQAEVPLTCTLERPVQMCGPIQVPPGHVFMMGDNRNSSHDSRYWHFLPVDRIIGKAVFRFWPLGRISPIGNEFPPQNGLTYNEFKLR